MLPIGSVKKHTRRKTPFRGKAPVWCRSKTLRHENEYSCWEKAKRLLVCDFLMVIKSEPLSCWRRSNINTWLSCWCTHGYFRSLQMIGTLWFSRNSADRVPWLLNCYAEISVIIHNSPYWYRGIIMQRYLIMWSSDSIIESINLRNHTAKQ